MAKFPTYRPRRLRRTERLRAMVRETSLEPADLIAPLFVTFQDGRHPVSSMPGVEQTSIAATAEEAARLESLGVGAVLLFGIPDSKDAHGSRAYAADGEVQRAVGAIKEQAPDLVVITDVCLCEYTDHGHCGLLTPDGEVHNDSTLELLARMAVSHAEAGADIVAPSDMMDGRVAAIRQALDAQGFSHTPIMSYAVKYASAFYGPFREAAESAPQFGDRKGYQMDPGNVEEGLREARMDIEEGADIIMVKPALPYLDVIYRVKQDTGYPLAAYHVSGEYSMIKAAAERGWIDEERVMLEAVQSIRRAGADMIITYYAGELARQLGG
ncbi:MAG: porphobilinogen synthase [Gemmatimonadota bacterium]|nr:MAG: porphobilinogen synthase [Gemmatimonadota bacterium]